MWLTRLKGCTKKILLAKIFLALHKRGWGQLGRTAVGLFSEGMNLFIE